MVVKEYEIKLSVIAGGKKSNGIGGNPHQERILLRSG